MIFSKDSDSYSPFTLHVQGKTCCVVLPPCHFAFKKQKRYIKSCSSFKLAADGVVVWCFDHMLCVWQTTGRVQKKKGKQPAVISHLQDKAPENVCKLGRQWWKNRRVLPGVTLEAKCCCVKCQTSLAEAAMCQYHSDTLMHVQICLVSVKKKKYSICSATLT